MGGSDWTEGVPKACPQCHTEIPRSDLYHVDEDNLMGFSHRGITVWVYTCPHCTAELSIRNNRRKGMSWRW